MALNYVSMDYQHSELNTQFGIPPSYMLKAHNLKFKRYKTLPFQNFVAPAQVGLPFNIRLCDKDNIEKFVVGISICTLPYDSHATQGNHTCFCALSEFSAPNFIIPPAALPLRFDRNMFYPSGNGVFNADHVIGGAATLANAFPNYLPLASMEYTAVIIPGTHASFQYSTIDKIHAQINQPYSGNKELYFNGYVFDCDHDFLIYGNLIYMECVRELN